MFGSKVVQRLAPLLMVASLAAGCVTIGATVAELPPATSAPVTPFATATASPAARSTAAPTSAPGMTPTPTPAPTPAMTPAPTPTASPSPTPRPTATRSPRRSPQPTSGASPTPHPTATPSPTDTPTPTPTDGLPTFTFKQAPDRLVGRVLDHGSRNDKVVALTFDDCYNTSDVRQIADILRSEGVGASFFPVGEAVKASPSLWRSIAADFSIGNHTMHHAVLTRLDYAGAYIEVGRAQQQIGEIIRRDPIPAFRPPDGSTNATVLQVANDLGLAIVKWDVDTRDWEKTTTADQIVARALKAQDGSIILMHAMRPSTIEALPLVIAGLRERGFEIVGVDQLLGLPW